MELSLPDDSSGFRRLWESVEIVRGMPYTLFTFGETALPYWLVVAGKTEDDGVNLRRGELTVSRPTIITPNSAPPGMRGRPELAEFFEDDDEEEDWMGDAADGERAVRFLMARGIDFSGMAFGNRAERRETLRAGVEETVERLLRRIDDEGDRTAVLSAPHGLGGVALLRYAAEKAMESAPGNLKELRERGFLP